MSTIGTADNNQMVITRSNSADANVSNVDIGDNNMQPTDNNIANNQVISRDTSSDYNVNALGNQSQEQGANYNLNYTYVEMPTDAEYDIHGQLQASFTQTVKTLTITDSTVNDGRTDSGDNFQRRSNSITTNAYPVATQ